MQNDSIKKQIIKGMTYTAIQKYSGVLISIILSMILSRLLTPQDFGVIGIATVIISFFSLFSEMGFGAAIIQKKELTQDDLNSIFTFTVYLGLSLCLLFFFSSYKIADFYNDKRLISICQLMSVNLLFAGFNIVPNALLLKDKNFKFIAIRTLIIQLFFGIAAVIAAFCGLGVYSLILESLFSGIFIFIITYRLYPMKFQGRIKWLSIKKVASYSFFQFLFGVINFFTRNIDNLLIGKFISLKQLGYYQKSYSLMMMPVQNITSVITPTLHPILSEFQKDPSFIKEKYNHILRLLAVFGFPVSILLFFCAKEIIIIMFGFQWEASIPVFQILSLTVGLQIIGSTVGSIFQALNATKWLAFMGIINTIYNVSAFVLVLCLWGTIESLAWAWVSSSIIGLWGWPFMYHVLFKSSCKSFLQAILPGFCIAVILSLFLFALSYILLASNLVISLLVKLIMSLIVWSIFVDKWKILNLKVLGKNIFRVNREHRM